MSNEMKLIAALKLIADSEEFSSDTFVCDFSSLQSVARAALKDLVTPPAAQVQGEQPEVVGQLALDEPFNGTDGLEIGEWEFVPDRAAVESMLAVSTGEMVPLMTVAQHERIVAGTVEHYRAQFAELHAARNLLSRLSRAGFELGDDPASSIIAALSAPPAAGVPEEWSIERTPDGAFCISSDDGEHRALFASWGNRNARAVAAFLEAMLAAAPTPPASEQQRAVVMPKCSYLPHENSTKNTSTGE